MDNALLVYLRLARRPVEVAANEDYDGREGTVVVKQKGAKTIDVQKIQSDIIKDILSKGMILPETVDKLCRILNDMKRTIEGYKVDAFSVVAGPNIRQASNDLVVLEQIKMRTGFSPIVLSNSEQRFLGYQAVASTENFDSFLKG